MNIFVNPSITNGINAYIAKTNNKDYSLEHYFELEIVEFLIKVYGKINILNPYQINSIDSLKSNLMVYGLNEEYVQKIFILLNEYNLWLNSKTREKNNIIKDIFEILSEMVILKNKQTVVTSEEMKYYEDFLTLKDNRIKKIAELASNNIDDIIKVWPSKVEENSKSQIKEEPVMLSESTYEKYGISLEDVKKLPEDKLKDLNAEINKRNENDQTGGGTTKEKPWQLVLTSGNGFVDALVLFSIMCTEIMIGIIITVIIWRF